MNVKIVKDGVPNLMKAFAALTRNEVLVGIPDETADRPPQDGKSSPITNAGIGYVMEFGAPEKNIPARPHLIPGIKSVEDKIAKGFLSAAKKVLTGDVKSVASSLQKIGDIASSAVKRKIEEGPFEPLKPSTIEQRLKRHKRRKGEREYLKKLSQGMTHEELSALNLVKPLIDTGEYRRAITSVVRKKGK